MRIPQKKTKIIATIGPSSSSEKVISRLIGAGVNVFRLNFSHGTIEEHKWRIETIRRVSQKLDEAVGILADLAGPKIRTGKTEANKSITLKKGDTVQLTAKKTLCTQSCISIPYVKVLKGLEPGQEILLNDGAVRLRVEDVDRKNVKAECRILNTGDYSSNKGVNFPSTHLPLPSLTSKDKKDLEFILNSDVDYIALSFVRRASDLAPLSRLIKRSGKNIKLIAKIEKPEAAENALEIVERCDGIMVARGDLGVETSPYVVPKIQKDLIAHGNRCGKFVIVATQMLESMIKNPIPTRAESTDVANAILDGTDACMLSGETAVGEYPVEAVETITRIAQVIENSIYYRSGPENLSLKNGYPPHSLCEAASWASRDLGNVPVLVYTMSGDTALYMAKIRCQSPIIALSPNRRAVSMLALAWNTRPFFVPFEKDLVELQQKSELQLVQKGLLMPNQLIVVLSGTTPVHGATNFMRVKRVGEK